MTAATRTNLSIQTVYCTSAKLAQHEVTNGSIYYTTDTHQVSVDVDNKRFEFDSVICVADLTALNKLTEAYTPSTEKLYYVKNTKNIYVYNGSQFVVVSAPAQDILDTVATKYGVEFVATLPATGVKDKIYITAATDPIGNLTKDVYVYNNGFIKVTPEASGVKKISDDGLIDVLTAIDAKLAAIKLDFTTSTGSTTIASIEQTLSSYYNKAQVDKMFADLRAELGL